MNIITDPINPINWKVKSSTGLLISMIASLKAKSRTNCQNRRLRQIGWKLWKMKGVGE